MPDKHFQPRCFMHIEDLKQGQEYYLIDDPKVMTACLFRGFDGDGNIIVEVFGTGELKTITNIQHLAPFHEKEPLKPKHWIP